MRKGGENILLYYVLQITRKRVMLFLQSAYKPRLEYYYVDLLQYDTYRYDFYNIKLRLENSQKMLKGRIYNIYIY